MIKSCYIESGLKTIRIFPYCELNLLIFWSVLQNEYPVLGKGSVLFCRTPLGCNLFINPVCRSISEKVYHVGPDQTAL